MSRLSWTSKKFLEDKVQELLRAVEILGVSPVAQSSIQEYVTLANGVKECFLKVGILEEVGKEGKKPLLRINFANCNVSKVYAAYRFKDLNKKKPTLPRIPKPSIDKQDAIAKGKAKTKDLTSNSKEVFPSLEDCTKYLKHHYGLNYEVVFIQEGYKLDSFTVKSTK